MVPVLQKHRKYELWVLPLLVPGTCSQERTGNGRRHGCPGSALPDLSWEWGGGRQEEGGTHGGVDRKEKPSFQLQEEGRVSLFILALINSAPWCHQSSNHTADGADVIGKRGIGQNIKAPIPYK